MYIITCASGLKAVKIINMEEEGEAYKKKRDADYHFTG